MATLPIAPQLEVLDLRHFSARQLRTLLESEARVWKRLLRWDYTSSTELLLEYLDSRILTGFVALERGRVCGYTFCVYEGHKAVIGDAFASFGAVGNRAGEIRGDRDTTRVLLHHMLSMLRYSPSIDRVEAQLLLFNAGDFAESFLGPEYRLFQRLFLECDLRQPSGLHLAGSMGTPAVRDPIQGVVQIPEELDVATWRPEDYQAAAELIHACYRGHGDAEINDQYRTLHGCLRFMHNIVRFPGCGAFDAGSSWVLRDRQTGRLGGLLLASRVGEDVAHITQLCVLGRYRGRGLGKELLRRGTASLRNAGMKAITLTVTEDNEEALRLYRQCGFLQRHRFDAMVMDKSRMRE